MRHSRAGQNHRCRHCPLLTDSNNSRPPLSTARGLAPPDRANRRATAATAPRTTTARRARPPTIPRSATRPHRATVERSEPRSTDRRNRSDVSRARRRSADTAIVMGRPLPDHSVSLPNATDAGCRSGCPPPTGRAMPRRREPSRASTTGRWAGTRTPAAPRVVVRPRTTRRNARWSRKVRSGGW